MPLLRSIRFRYSLRALLIATSIAALWLAFYVSPLVIEGRARRLLQRHGADFGYRDGTSALERLLGYQAVDRLEITSCMDVEIVKAILGLKGLSVLTLRAPLPAGAPNTWPPDSLTAPQMALPPGVLEHILADLRLHSLEISDFALDERTFADIARHDSIESLAFERVNVSESALATLLTLPNLSKLMLDSCPCTGTDLSAVHGSISLHKVTCFRTPIGIEFARFLARCQNLRDFMVASHPSTCDDQFIFALGSHPSLTGLWIEGGRFTDRCLSVIEDMPALRNLKLHKGISHDGQARLRTARPDIAQ